MPDQLAYVTQILSSLRPQALEKNVQLEIEVAAEPITVVANARSIGQVLLNLMSNGVKFTLPVVPAASPGKMLA